MFEMKCDGLERIVKWVLLKPRRQLKKCFGSVSSHLNVVYSSRLFRYYMENSCYGFTALEK